ncbi:hypothetical protein Ancab_018829 [Ancistrocladus abbreviatus]
MEEKNDGDPKLEELMLPGFRFHPTDEELVGFYLKRKIQQRPLSIELIKQLDIYKYDPWDLPKLAVTGEKEWYFYCPRDRKYRNSARPNRVTGAGFWKATGTDRPIYSSEGSKCIGLKKSLVFYKGRAAKGTKTDWMMHEFRLPTLADSVPSKRCMDKSPPASDSWAICRIFKKTSSMTHRAISHSWVTPPLPQPDTCSTPAYYERYSSHLSSESIPLTAPKISSDMQITCTNDTQMTQLPLLDFSIYKSMYPPMTNKPCNKFPISSSIDLPNAFMLPPLELSEPSKCNDNTDDISSILLDMSALSALGHLSNNKPSENPDFDGQNGQFNSFPFNLAQELIMQAGNADNGLASGCMMDSSARNDVAEDQWDLARSIGFPVGLPAPEIPEAWNSSLLWECLPCPAEVFTTK